LFKKIAATLIMALVATVGLATPAFADPSCPFDRICFFDAGNWQADVNYPKYVVNPSGLAANTCYNFGIDPTGFNWDKQVDSIWWNDILYPDGYVEIYSGWNCTGYAISRAGAWPPVDYQMQSCTEPAAEWNGPCGDNEVFNRPRSWAFNW
jgi:hypothetical protein